ncbi:MAG: class I tRNA ligase family protein, partial [Clostridia bacterium]|nr:class I tRNA ligase family protein [Clostridia bacterium]
MQKVYQPQLFENDIYSWWTQQGYFKPDTTKKQHFTIVIPPPNITAQLHIGHAL